MSGEGSPSFRRPLEDGEPQQRAAELQDAILDALPANIALIDPEGVILTVNESWRQFGAANAIQGKDFFVGHNYLEICERAEGECAAEAKVTAKGIRRVLRGEIPEFSLEYPCHSPTRERWYRLMASPLRSGVFAGAVVMHIDVTQRKNAEIALSESERRQRQLAADLESERVRLVAAQRVGKVGSWETDLNSLMVLWSEETHRIFETDPKTFVPDHARFLSMVHPEDRDGVGAAFLRSLGEEGVRSIAHRIVVPQDRIKIVEESWQVFRDGENRPVRAIGTCRDITERSLFEKDLSRTHRALQMLSRCNEALIRNDREEALLKEICTIATEVGGYRMAWVGYALEDERRSIVPQASSGVDDDYVAALQLSWAADTPLGQGPAGRTVRTGQPVIVEDLSKDEYFKPWLPAATARNFRSVISLPLSAGSRVMGNLALYSSEARTIASDELELLRNLADNLAFGIGNLRSRLERRKTHEAVLAMARGLSAATGAEFFDKLVLSLVEVLGAGFGCIAQMVTPDRRQVRTLAAALDGNLVPKFDLDLAGMPCDHPDSQEVCVIPRELIRLHPAVADRLPGAAFESYVGVMLRDGARQPIGVMFAQSRLPISEPDFAASTLRIFAARAAAEMEREKVAARTREQAALLDKAQDAILVRNLEHRILYWNKSAERLYGWTAEEAIGQSVRTLLYFESGPFDFAMEHLLANGEWVGELVQMRKDGSPLTIEGRWTLVKNEVGEAHSVLAINTDITERKKLEAQFLRAQRMESIGTLAGGIAHDLNNLLAPIMMGVDLLKRFEPSPDSQRVIGNIERSARRGADLVKQVLSFARGVEGSRVAVDLRHIIREIEIIGQNTFPKHIRFEVQVPRDLWLVTGDPTQLNQVLLNLCVNARDAMPDGGTLTIAAINAEVDAQYAVMNRGVAAGRYVTLEVNDTGSGMSRAVQDRIFEPFFTTKEVGKGTGLGLSTVLGIVRSHGGFVNVYSESKRGSTFKVYLPAQEEGRPEGGEADQPVSLPRGSGETVLLVDDEAPILEVTRETLESFGYKVFTAEDGAQAIGVYATHRDKIAVVLTDMMMPVMDGAALIAALRRISPTVKIIAASGLSDNSNVARAAGAGVRNFLAKPYSADAMLTAIRRALDS